MAAFRLSLEIAEPLGACCRATMGWHRLNAAWARHCGTFAVAFAVAAYASPILAAYAWQAVFGRDVSWVVFAGAQALTWGLCAACFVKAYKGVEGPAAAQVALLVVAVLLFAIRLAAGWLLGGAFDSRGI